MRTLTRDAHLPSVRIDASTRSRRARWTGHVLSTIAVLFLFVDSLGKLFAPPTVVAGSAALGYPAGTLLPLGVILLLCVVTYVMPSTAVLGAVLLTGYLGGAIATHVRVESPLLTHTLFPVYVALFVWGGLFLRETRLRTLLPRRLPRATSTPANEARS